jgi:hypothetical protein
LLSFVKEIVDRNRSQGKAVQITSEIFKIKRLIKVEAKVSFLLVFKFPNSEVSWSGVRHAKFFEKITLSAKFVLFFSTALAKGAA